MEQMQKCVACHYQPLQYFGTRHTYQYFQCPDCKTIQLNPQPTASELMLAYQKEYANANHYQSNPRELTEAAMPYYRSLVRVIDDYKVSGDILDYGAGWGGLCQQLLNEGYHCRGVEIAEEMVAYCQENNIPVEQGDIFALQPDDEALSAMVLCTVFEHLIDHDEWMQQAYQLLDDDGLLITLQPTANFAEFMGNLLRLNNVQRELPQLHQVYAPPWHTAFFSEAGMRQLAERHNFELVETRPAPQGQRDGMLGLAQRALQQVNNVGQNFFGNDWVLLLAHIFVLRKK